jgi:taurine dioxygenase
MPRRHFGPREHVRSERERLAALRFDCIGVTPMSATCGAEISRVDLGDIDDATFAEIERAFLEYKVIFFRDQDITTDQHLAFAGRFGELEEHPFIPAKDGYAMIVDLKKDEHVKGVENVWHSDVSWREVPSLGSVLRAAEVPSIGGDTLFSDMEAAFAGLAPETQRRIDGLKAVHDFTNSFGLAMSDEQRAKQLEKFPPARHPVVRTHPVTGRKSIFVNSIFTNYIEGMSPDESTELLDHLYAQADVPEYQCRFRWQKNSVALWDNRSLQHYASSDYDPQPRRMERVTVIGDVPR